MSYESTASRPLATPDDIVYFHDQLPHLQPSDPALPSHPHFDTSSPPDTNESDRSSPPPNAPERQSKSRREKPRLELAPDQPLTTQGRPRTRVFVACVQCRGRKIRCDGARPSCYNCSRRSDDNVLCTYDAAPKRRGPDKTPGARQRVVSGCGADQDQPRRRRRHPPDVPVKVDGEEAASGAVSNEASPSRKAHSATPPLPTHNLSPSLTLRPLPSHLESAGSRGAYARSHQLTPIVIPTPNIGPAHHSPEGVLYSQVSPYTPVPTLTSLRSSPQRQPRYEPDTTGLGHPTMGSAFPLSVPGSALSHGNEEVGQSTSLPAEPSMRYAQETYWEVVLSFYSTNYDYPQGHPGPLPPGLRQSATHRVYDDIRFLLQYSSYWLSFLNVNRLLRRLQDPIERTSLQPAFVLGALALSTFLQSSDSEHGSGARGRERALRLRDEAQGALEASLSARWVDDNLVQASWVIAFFEVCVHPLHSTERVRAALGMLDSLIRCLALTSVDAGDPRVSTFVQRSAPVLPLAGRERRHVSREEFDAAQHPPHSPPPPRLFGECWCSAYTLGQMSPGTTEIAPLWSHTPAWVGDWTEGDIRKEECRRLVWSTVIMVAGYTSYNAAYTMPHVDLFVLDPANFALLLPGESLFRAATPASKDSVWALYMRSLLLWNGCVRMRADMSMSDAEKAQYAMDTWMEIDRIEETLNSHTCDIERTFLFVSRDYLFIARLYTYYDLQRYAPNIEVNANIIRSKAKEWLTHHDSMAKRAMYGLHTVTGQPTSSLSGRPFYLWWFMGHISRMITMWTTDNSLVMALQTCKSLFAPLQYLMSLWPCAESTRRAQELEKRMISACHAAGVPAPAPLAYSPRFLDGSI
ncbi:uncharacterized protein LAESUDRAFT_641362 [Laetiporus sulphureus 93-53]|uniref:Zn(2)-C6 fungal-type domain-containing protein n=1 Tax=Laetiporus sulphureus 93-53 TaxID=1314785 RepID=A0A165HQL3_9APHY|nr:uncharacterized protein LAESUDRAFT_641362 [Laetiporus sulphureus 93-53]KZT12056.1 hypothetical protein LAESUDRAFT_641362 [Laetiporus sulphureus 93-53]